MDGEAQNEVVQVAALFEDRDTPLPPVLKKVLQDLVMAV